VEVYDIVKGGDPTTRIRICGGDDWNARDGETARVVSGRVGRIREGLLPPFDGGIPGAEFDAGEEVYSRPRDPRFGDDATGFERHWFVV
jgi:hypothetical protein